MQELIERLAKEAGWDVDSDGITMPYLSGYYDPADETRLLTKFAALIAEACAKEAAAYNWFEDADPNTGPDDVTDRLAAAIRAKFPMPALNN